MAKELCKTDISDRHDGEFKTMFVSILTELRKEWDTRVRSLKQR